MQCTPRAIWHRSRVQRTFRPPQRTEQTEIEELSEKQRRLQCFALLCFKPLFGQDERYQRLAMLTTAEVTTGER